MICRVQRTNGSARWQMSSLVTREQTTIVAQKGEQIKGQIAEIQLEADQANELIKKLGAETLEPRNCVAVTHRWRFCC